MDINWKIIHDREKSQQFLNLIEDFLDREFINIQQHTPNEMWQSMQNFVLPLAVEHLKTAALDYKPSDEIDDMFEHIVALTKNKKTIHFNNENDSREQQQPLPISTDEISKSLFALKNGKKITQDCIPLELWKSLPNVKWLQHLFNKILFGESMPDVWRQSYILPLYKNNGSPDDVTNYRATTAECHTLKIFEKIIMARIAPMFNISNNQFGVAGKSQKKAIKVLSDAKATNNTTLYMLFFDLKNAMGTFCLTTISHVLKARGVPKYYIDVIEDIYSGSTAQIIWDGKISKSIPLMAGPHEGSVMGPFLLMAAIDYIIPNESNYESYIIYNDDFVLMENDKNKLAQIANAWIDKLKKFGFEINMEKVAFMKFGNDKQQQNVSEKIIINDCVIDSIDCHTFLGIKICK